MAAKLTASLTLRHTKLAGERLRCDGGEEGVLEFFVAFGYVCSQVLEALGSHFNEAKILR